MSTFSRTVASFSGGSSPSQGFSGLLVAGAGFGAAGGWAGLSPGFAALKMSSHFSIV
ncbi:MULTISPECIES: hypothetical protein [Cyanophyceae]|uniref:hypothetical protein n=1 Tax=Cyanophyceae TaxID=3028117 RepID=UPI0016858C08|nr:hypothetical protein [Nodosilinea sp. FACHB-141]MBD2115256.1 hypothetical protein [Nodosilinea sp. FACHB-141]